MTKEKAQKKNVLLSIQSNINAFHHKISPPVKSNYKNNVMNQRKYTPNLGGWGLFQTAWGKRVGDWAIP